MFHDRQVGSAKTTTPPRLVCWSRMQAEAGQALTRIVARKEIERIANEGVFMWGVGNAPGGEPARLARAAEPVDLVLSVMKSRPKAHDVAPGAINVWRRYLDEHGVERDLPAGSLVSSRARPRGEPTRGHYALMARSDRPLGLRDLGPFNPAAYRNVGGRGAGVGSSQVTALLRLAEPEAVDDGGYRASIRAMLTGGYWVRLADPVRVEGAALRAFHERIEAAAAAGADAWIDTVEAARRGPARSDPSPTLFDRPFARAAAFV